MRLIKGLTAILMFLTPGLLNASVSGASETTTVIPEKADKDTVFIAVMPESLDSITRVMEQRLAEIEKRVSSLDTIREAVISPEDVAQEKKERRYAERESQRANNWMKGKSHPFDRGIDQVVFVPKGQWIVGGNLSFQDYTEGNYKFLIADQIDLQAYMMKVSPFIGYFIADNTAIGARFVYSRTSVDLGNVTLKINDDLSFALSDVTYLQHQYDISLFLRNYINLGNQRRIGLFNETRLTYGGGQGKMVNSSKEDVTGTYQQIQSYQLGLAPGIVAFITDNVGVEVSVGVLGLKYSTIKQTTNQVETGKHAHTSANFKINLFSINLGMAFYINSMRGLNPVNYKLFKSTRKATEDDFEKAIKTKLDEDESI